MGQSGGGERLRHAAREDLPAIEANHRIANHLDLLLALVRLQLHGLRGRSEGLSVPEASGVLQDVASRIRAIAAIHRQLAQRPAADDDIDIGLYLRDLCQDLHAALDARAALDCSRLRPGRALAVGTAIPLALMTCELMTNAMRHGCPNGGRIVVGLRGVADGGIEVEVSDTGPGLPAGLDPVTEGGIGLQLLRRLGEQLQARLEFRSGGKGLCVRITLPAGIVEG